MLVEVPHPDFGEAVTAVIVTDSGANISEQAIVDHVKAHAANFKVPKAVYFIDSLLLPLREAKEGKNVDWAEVAELRKFGGIRYPAS